MVMKSSLDLVREKFQAALVDHERRVLLGIVADELPRMTLGELSEIVTSELGANLKPLRVAELLDLVTERGSTLRIMDFIPGELPRLPVDLPERLSSTKRPAAGSVAEIAADVHKALEGASGPMSAQELRTATRHPAAKLAQAIRTMLSEHRLVRLGAGRSTQYALTSSSPPPSSGGPGEASDKPGVLRRRGRPAPSKDGS